MGVLCCIMTGICLERIFHRKWWDYSKNRLQFEGYINIWHLAFFGTAAESAEDNCGILDSFLDEHFPNERMERIYPNAKREDNGI